MTDSGPKQIPPFGLRMPPDLKERVSRAAERNNRSMNAEIVATLEEKYPAPEPIDERARQHIALLLRTFEDMKNEGIIPRTEETRPILPEEFQELMRRVDAHYEAKGEPRAPKRNPT